MDGLLMSFVMSFSTKKKDQHSGTKKKTNKYNKYQRIIRPQFHVGMLWLVQKIAVTRGHPVTSHRRNWDSPVFLELLGFYTKTWLWVMTPGPLPG